jgi:diguanylate cyclase (GGDEF)-like protein/PAS domain S-box-containing protein
MVTSSSGEQQRLDALYALKILDTPAEPIFDELARLAASLCKTPIATVTLIDESRQWFKASIGLDVTETPRTISFCNHVVQEKRPFVIEDARREPEFEHNPLVTGSPFIRFYAGVPLLTEDGLALGALAVMDQRPRKLSQEKRRSLAMLARQVMAHIELRHQRNDLSHLLASREAINRQLQWQAHHLREAQRIANLGSWEMDIASQRLWLSDETYRMFRVEQAGQAVTFADYMKSVHRDDAERVVHAVERAIADHHASLDLVHRIVRNDREIRYVHERGQLVETEAGEVCLAGTVQDITESFLSQKERELLYASICKVNDSVMITEASPIEEPGPRIVFVNRAFEVRTGYHHTEVLGRSPRLLQGPETQRNELDRIHQAIQHHRSISVEIINYTKQGNPFWLEMEIAPVAIQGETVTHFVSIQHDITARKAIEGQIEQLAFYDSLTKLPNRRLLMDRLEHAIETARRKRNSGALLFIDLDNFKSLNDTLGHDKGDMLLVEVARRLEKTVRKSNTVARLGGDEFVILLEDLAADRLEAAAEAEIVGEKLIASFGPLFKIGEYEHDCTPSIGVAIFDEKTGGVDDIMKRADLAMYQAKAAGRNAIRFFDQHMQSQVNTRVKLERELRRAVQSGQFVLHYQPQMNDVGKLSGAEALVRWQHPRRGLLHPGDFIWLAEENGLILQLGQWVLQSACQQLAMWQSHKAMPVPRIAINVSAREFHHPEFLPRTLEVLEAAGIDPRHIKLELTESALVEQIEDTVTKMAELKAHGIRFSLDDFGTGYSSLAYLRKLPLDEIKIDQAFVRDILTDEDDAAITQTIVSLCQILGFEVIAEGVENEGQQAMLARQGCRHYQGYWVGHPVPAALL